MSHVEKNPTIVAIPTGYAGATQRLLARLTMLQQLAVAVAARSTPAARRERRAQRTLATHDLSPVDM